jgi:phosphosulfolactate phosphohydrolase-like enzyme
MHFPNASLTDAARVAAAVWVGCQADAAAFIRLARNARVLEKAGRDADIEFALRMNSVDFAAVIVDGAVVRKSDLPSTFPGVE